MQAEGPSPCGDAFPCSPPLMLLHTRDINHWKNRIMQYLSTKWLFTALVAVGLLGLTACDQTIDKEPEQSVPPDQVFANIPGAEGALTAAYSGLQQDGMYGGFPVIAADFTADVTNFTGSFRTWNNAENFNVTASHGPTQNIWSDHYDTINRANLVIDNAADVPNISQSKVDDLVGQAKFIRALTYFNLVRWFGQPFEPGAENNQPAVILQTEAVESTEPEFNKPRASVGEVYAQIRADLEDAVSRLDVKGARKRAGQGSANALLAKVSLYQGRWQEAADRAQSVIDQDVFSLSAPAEPYQNESSTEIVFAVSFSSIDNTGVNAFPSSFYLPSPLGGRGDANPLAGFLTDAEDGDIRASLGEFNGDALLYELEGEVWTNKWTESTLGDDAPVLRTSEMFLIRAEALARLGNESEALDLVNDIRTRADLPEASGLTGQELIDEIIRQRRYELAFEGDRRHDLQRLGRTINSGAASAEPGNPQRILPIPQRAIDVNDALTEDNQNPGY